MVMVKAALRGDLVDWHNRNNAELALPAPVNPRDSQIDPRKMRVKVLPAAEVLMSQF